MNILKLAVAAAVAVTGFSLPAAAQDHRGDRDQYERHDRDARDDNGRHEGWERGRHRGWQGHNRRHRICRWTWRYHHRVRVCTWRRW